MMGSFSGVKIVTSQFAMQRVENWPVKKRSRRLHKKLTKKHGPQFTEKPCAFMTPHGYVVHPDIYTQLRALSARKGGEA